MFNLSGSEVVVLLLLALIVLGPERLPDAIRSFGRVYGQLRRMGDGFQAEMRSALDEPMRELRETADLARRAVTEVPKSLGEATEEDLDGDGTRHRPDEPPVTGTS